MVFFRSPDHLHVEADSCRCGRTSPRIRCVGRTDGMLIHKAMNVFSGAIRDVVLQEYAADPRRQRIEESVRARLRVRVAVELLDRGTIPLGEYKNSLTYAADARRPPT